MRSLRLDDQPLISGGRFQVDGRYFYVSASSIRTLYLLEEIVLTQASAEDRFWLLRCRTKVREIESLCDRAVLTFVVENTCSRKVRCLAIWLRGRCGGTFGTKILARFLIDPSPEVRRELARAFQRMHAWSELRIIARCDPEDRIRHMARQRGPQEHRGRLSRFLTNVAPEEYRPGDRRLAVAPEVDFRSGRAPKPSWLLRSVLERIRRIVRGTGNCAVAKK